MTSGGKDIKWNGSEATYYINTSGGPAGSIDAVVSGMQTWTDVAISNFTFIYGGTTTSTAHGINDAVNIVTFGSLAVGTAAENRYWYFVSSGQLIDSDIQFNTYYTWGTTGSSDTFDVQNVGTHEHGHSLCLKDLYNGSDSQKTMYYLVSTGETKKQTLDQDDIDGITYLYTCPNPPVKIYESPVEYSFIQDAYDASISNDTLQIQATVFTENLFIDQSTSVYWESGYNCDYTIDDGISIVEGNITISGGLLKIVSGSLIMQ
jgi:hypothetical protein